MKKQSKTFQLPHRVLIEPSHEGPKHTQIKLTFISKQTINIPNSSTVASENTLMASSSSVAGPFHWAHQLPNSDMETYY